MADAVVYRVGTSPLVQVAVYANDNGGVADPTLLALVEFGFELPGVIMVNDTIQVRSAVFVTADIEYNVWLLPETPDTILPTLEAGLREAWAAETGLGLTSTYRGSQRVLCAGIARVEPVLPATNIVSPPEGQSPSAPWS